MPKAPAKRATKGAAPQRQNSKPDPTKAAKKKAKAEPQAREVIYPEIDVKVCVGENALTAEQAKALLQWEEEGETKFGSDFALTDEYGRKVRLWNNPRNRPLDKSTYRMLMSEILNHHWHLNGETMIIGKTGVTISCQHRLVALVLAVQEWERNKENWPMWETEPTIECLICFGIDEEDDVVNTIDTGKPRSLADVIYRSDLFIGMPNKDRINVARITANALKAMGSRTGAWKDAFVPGRVTHADSLDYIARHPGLLGCVKHIFEEDEEGNVSKYLPPGYAAAMTYLMGCAASDPQRYFDGDPPSESLLDWSLKDKAEEFWVMLASGNDAFAALRNAKAKLNESSEGEPSLAEKAALLIKAWNLYAQDKPITSKGLTLKYSVDEEDGTKTLIEHPTVGGIDRIPEDKEDVTEEESDPTPEEIEERAAEVRQEGKTKKRGKPKTTGALAIGDECWVLEGEDVEAAWKGILREVRNVPGGKVANVEIAPGFAQAGKRVDVPFGKLHAEQPTAAAA